MELEILNFIQEKLRTDLLDRIFVFFTKLGDAGIIWIALAIILFIIPKTRRLGICMMISLIVELTICNGVLKPLLRRARPFTKDATIELLIEPPTDYSFPSGHTGSSFACTGVLFKQRSMIAIPSLVVAILISLSRLYLYVHYPTDVLAGLLIGLVSGWAGCYLTTKIPENKWVK